MKVVLDTNVILISISRRSKFHPIFAAIEDKKFEVLVTTDILFEYEEVIEMHMGQLAASSTLDGFQNLSNVTKIEKYYLWKLITQDPDDDKFVDCAVAGNADFIVSDDNHFKILKNVEFPKVKVISSEEFLEMLTSP